VDFRAKGDKSGGKKEACKKKPYPECNTSPEDQKKRGERPPGVAKNGDFRFGGSPARPKGIHQNIVREKCDSVLRPRLATSLGVNEGGAVSKAKGGKDRVKKKKKKSEEPTMGGGGGGLSWGPEKAAHMLVGSVALVPRKITWEKTPRGKEEVPLNPKNSTSAKVKFLRLTRLGVAEETGQIKPTQKNVLGQTKKRETPKEKKGKTSAGPGGIVQQKKGGEGLRSTNSTLALRKVNGAIWAQNKKKKLEKKRHWDKGGVRRGGKKISQEKK